MAMDRKIENTNPIRSSFEIALSYRFTSSNTIVATRQAQKSRIAAGEAEEGRALTRRFLSLPFGFPPLPICDDSDT